MRSYVLLTAFTMGCMFVDADAATLQVSPLLVGVTNGDSVNVNLIVSGIGSPAAMEVGSFDIFVGFNPALVTPTGVTFGLFLGDPTLFEALTTSAFTASVAEAVEVSLLSNADLDALQTSSSFTLATLSFTAIGSGTAAFTYLGGPVDDGNGVLIAGTKLEIPEPSFALPIIVLLLAGAAWRFRGRVATLRTIALIVAVAALSPAVRADGTAIAKSKANPEMKDGKFKYPQVDTACTLTVKNTKGKPAQGTLEVNCTFTNATDQAWDFIYCSMLGLKNKAGANRKAPNNSPNFGLEPIPAGGDTFKCKAGGDTGTRSFNSGWHFGCKTVNVPAGKGKTASVNFKSTDSQSGSTEYIPQAAAMITTLKADDFQISYSDTIFFTATATKFDPTTCVNIDATHKDLNGQDTFLVPNGTFASYWIQKNLDFKDPISRFQLITGGPLGPCEYNGDGAIDLTDITAILAARNTRVPPGSPGDADNDGIITANDARICVSKINKVYSTYDQSPCLPPAFPAGVAGLSPCQVSAAPIAPAVADINLYDTPTMWASPGIQFPAFLDILTSGNAMGRVDTDPEAPGTFQIPGGTEFYGYLKICSTANLVQCLPAEQSQDGNNMTVRINVRDASSSDLLFFQDGTFIQDGEPPVVTSIQTNFDPGHNLSIQVTATDAATSPIHSDFWFSTDGGTTWDHRSLDPLTDPLTEPSTQTFHGLIGTFTLGQPIRYFVSVQDEVYNITYVGIGIITP
jgi:hypothetical protein